ncbi:MAG: hypothetical protein U9Q63_04450 [Patescibacteria group bacterium]|nr:hypothetical protein [Patescibacteria group bacterium]
MKKKNLGPGEKDVIHQANEYVKLGKIKRLAFAVGRNLRLVQSS